MLRVDLNADVGESFHTFTDTDARLMAAITSASVAAGFHAGDPSVLRATIRAAREHGVAVGAHPSFPDLAGFGRSEMSLPPREIEDLVLYQIAAVAGVAEAEGVAIRHVKPHGALYNMAARDEQIALAIARAVAAFDHSLILFGPPASALLDAGAAAGLAVAGEGFADRAYAADGLLVPRSSPGAVLDDPDVVISRAVAMIRDRQVATIDGAMLSIAVDTLCIHSDTRGADRLAAALRARLANEGILVAAPPRP